MHNQANERLGGEDSKLEDGTSTRKRLISLDGKRRDDRLSGKQFLAALLMITLSTILVADLNRILMPHISRDSMERRSGSLTSPAWASWIGEVPTAAELYGDSSADMPTTEAFDDDDDEADEELDASASNEYPENENDNDNDESYEDQDENPDGAESRRKERWLAPVGAAATTPARSIEPPPGAIKATSGTRSPAVVQVNGGQGTWREPNTWRRNKRDLEDRIMLASRRAERRNRQGANDEFNVDDGDEDAWVHDGIDDIQIDPETKRAASELSYDEKSIDAEYEPYAQKEVPVLNRTRITTIAEVIPISDDSDSADRDATKVDWRFLPPPHNQQQASPSADGDGSSPTIYLPASYLTIDQAQRLISQQREQLQDQRNQLRDQERQLAAMSSEPSASMWLEPTLQRRQLVGDSRDASELSHSSGKQQQFEAKSTRTDD